MYHMWCGQELNMEMLTLSFTRLCLMWSNVYTYTLTHMQLLPVTFSTSILNKLLDLINL